METTHLVLFAAGALLAMYFAKRNAAPAAGDVVRPVAPVPPWTPASNGGPILEAVLAILKQLGEQQPLAGVQVKVFHPNSSVSIAVSKEEVTNNARPV